MKFFVFQTGKGSDAWKTYIHVMNILRDIDHIHETIRFYKKEHPGIKEVLLEI